MTARIITGDCRTALAGLADESVHCAVTSPPYFCLRDYGVDGQIGLEPTPESYVAELVGVFREVRRVLRKDGTWLVEPRGFVRGEPRLQTRRRRQQGRDEGEHR